MSSKPISRRVVGRSTRSVYVPVECVLPGLRGTILVTGGMIPFQPVPPPLSCLSEFRSRSIRVSLKEDSTFIRTRFFFITHTKERSGGAISFSFGKADSFIHVLHSFPSARLSFWIPKGRVASASSREWDRVRVRHQPTIAELSRCFLAKANGVCNSTFSSMEGFHIR